MRNQPKYFHYYLETLKNADSFAFLCIVTVYGFARFDFAVIVKEKEIVYKMCFHL